MNFNILTLFPDLLKVPLSQGVLGKACQGNLIRHQVISIRDFAENPYQSVDDRPFGGGDGMVLSYAPLKRALESISNKGVVIYLSPQGDRWNYSLAKDFAKKQKVITLICGRYSGVDARFVHQYVDEEISIGDYVLSGGEFPALVVMDSIARFIPGVLGHPHSATEDTFEKDDLLEYPQWTHPKKITGYKIPDVFFSGHHKKIKIARYYLSLLCTQEKRSDLLNTTKYQKDLQIARKWFSELSSEEQKATGISLHL